MALVVKDRVKETSTSTGTGAFTLAGAVDSFQTFASALTNGDTTYYAIIDPGTGEFEVGLGTFNATANTISRDTVLETSNGASLINFQAGEKEVFITYPADKAVYLDATGKVAPTTALMNTVKANDGAGSGVDADLLDGLHGSDFVLKAGDTISGNLTITGDLTVTGTTVTVNATELAIADNMIYMNEGSVVTNPDLGWSGNYNDGTYAHAGFFRDATDGRFKAYDGYTPEPDASPYIDTSHASFSLADIEANTFHGNLSGNASTATKLATARTVTLGGDLTGSVSFDGSANVTLSAAVLDDSHNHVISNVDGLQAALDAKADDTTTISAGTGLTGGGSIGVNRTLALDTAYTDGRYVNATGDSMTGDLTFGDNNKAIFGAGSDLQIYHTGSHSYIADTGTGDLKLYGEQVELGNLSGVKMLRGISAGEVYLYHNNTAKLWTLSTGINVSGNIAVSGTVDGVDVAAFKTSYDSHNHDDRYYTETEINTKLTDGSVTKFNPSSTDTFTGTYPVLWHDDNVTPYTSTWFTINGATDTLNVPNINLSGNVTVGGTVDGRDVAADGTKLDGIEAGATADQTAAEILTAIKTVDGAGSGLDADTLDGYHASSFLLTSGKAADSNLLDGYDSTRFFRRQAKANATVGPGWMTVAATLSSRFSGEVIVTDADSGDHAYIRLHWLRSYVDSAFSVINCGGHANRITGARVLYETADNTYGWKYLQVYVEANSNYEVNVYELGDIDDYGYPSVVTPVIEDTKTGYAVHGNEITGLDLYNSATEEGFIAGGEIRSNTGFSVNGSTVFHDGYHPNADKWTTARTLTLNGDVSGSVSWDGSGNVTLTTTVADDSHTHSGTITTSAYTTHTTPYGTIQLGPMNSSWSHIYTTAGTNFYFNQNLYVLGDKVFHDTYHPNADKLTTARNIALTGDVTGSANFDGSANISITAVVQDDSHNHVISNVDGLQPALDAKWPINGSAPTDLNSAGQGLWRINTGHTNQPAGTNYGTLLSFDNAADTGFQLASDYQGSAFYWRSGNASVYGGSGSFGAWRKIWHDGNDGSGSGLDADLLDGVHGSSFLRSDANDTATGIITFQNANDYQIALNGNGGPWAGIYWTDVGGGDYMWYNGANSTFAIGGGGSNVAGKKLHVHGGLSVGSGTASTSTPTNGIYSQGDISVAGNVVWHSGNDGSGSGLDADLLDGLHASSFLRKDTNDTSTGIISAATFNATSTTNGGFQGIDADSATNPSFTWTADLDTGMYRSGTNQIGFTTGGTVACTISGSNFNVVGALNAPTVDTNSVVIGAGVTLTESTDRADLLKITSSTSTWAGIQISNTSNEGLWSFMTDGTTGGIFDDMSNAWHIQFIDGGETRLYYAGAEKLNTLTTGVYVTGDFTASGVLYGNGSGLTNVSAVPPTTHDAVGTYAFAYVNYYTGIAFGTTLAGSSLQLAGVEGDPYYAVPSLTGAYRDSGSSSTVVGYVGGPTLSGTWRCMGVSAPRSTATRGMTLWVRIS